MGAGGSRVAADDAKTREARTTALNFVRGSVRPIVVFAQEAALLSWRSSVRGPADNVRK